MTNSPRDFTPEQLARLAHAVFYSANLCAPQNIEFVLKEIDTCAGGCEHVSSGGSYCYKQEKGEHCPFSLAEDLRNISLALYGPTDPPWYTPPVNLPPRLPDVAPGVHPAEELWRDCGLPEYFLGNGGSNARLYAFYEAARRLGAKCQAELVDALGSLMASSIEPDADSRAPRDRLLAAAWAKARTALSGADRNEEPVSPIVRWERPVAMLEVLEAGRSTLHLAGVKAAARADALPVGTHSLYLAPPSREERLREPAWRDVIAERERQRSVEGWTTEHDDEHTDGQLALAAACYAAPHAFSEKVIPHHWTDDSRYMDARSEPVGEVVVPSAWPWEGQWFKRADTRRGLVKAGALILAEIERLDRAALLAAKPEAAASATPNPQFDDPAAEHNRRRRDNY